MLWMNEYDIEEAQRRFGRGDTPNLQRAATVLANLRDWTNEHSDGWPYWQKPSRAAARLMTLIQSADRWDPTDCTAGQVDSACVPIRSFLTRQGADKAEVFA